MISVKRAQILAWIMAGTFLMFALVGVFSPEPWIGFMLGILGALFAAWTAFYLVAVTRGVASVRYNEQAAMQELKRMMRVIDTAYDGIVMTDTRGVIRYVNPSWEQITGYRAEEAVGKLTPAVLKSGYHDAEFYANLWLTIQNGKMFHGELVNKRKDGTFYRVDEVILPLMDDGGVTGYAAFHHDITSLKPVQPFAPAGEPKEPLTS